jgi:4-amino-4-deoxy-L-arabinose transferase-like glycosyltransferase
MHFNKFGPVIAIFLLALSLRYIFICTYNNGKFLKDIVYSPDGTGYDEIAMNFLKGKGFVVVSYYARRPPLYPAILAGIYFLTNHSIVAVRFVQGFIGALVCVIVCLLGSKILGSKVGILAGVICAVDYSLLQLSAYELAETFYIFFFLAAVFLSIVYYKYKKTPYLILSGLFVGLTSLCKDSGIFLAGLISVWLFQAAQGPLKSRIKDTIIFLFFSLVLILPWSLRNYYIFHRFIPLSVGFGHTLYLGNNEKTIALNKGYDNFSLMPSDVTGLFTPQTDDILKKRAVEFMLNNPGKTIGLTAKKFVNMWQPYYSDARRISKLAMIFSYLPVVVLGLIGLILALRRAKVTLLFVLIIGFYALLHMLTISGIRYRYPLMPFFIVYAAFVLQEFCKIVKKQCANK